MAEPVVEQLMDNIRTRMESAFENVHRSTRIATWQPKDWSLHVYQQSLEAAPDVSCPGNPPAQGWLLTAVVAGIVKPSDNETIAIDTFRNRMGAEIITAATDATNWHTWGSLALNTMFGNIEPYIEETGGTSGVMVRFAITFRTDENDPYTVRI